MNTIRIISPRFHDRTVLLAKWKVGDWNEINIQYPGYEQPLYMEGIRVRSYPVEKKKSKTGQEFEVYVVPIDDLDTLSPKQLISNTVEALGW